MSDLQAIKVSMLGACSLEFGGNVIDGKNVRSKRIWKLIEYLIIYRFRCVSQEELIDLIYPEEIHGNPTGALKTLLHRTREALSPLGCAEGKQIIIKCAGGYRWNPDIPIETDTERFESLIRQAKSRERDKQLQLKLRLAALELYRSDFLPEASSEVWAMSVAAYYHFQYMELVHSVLTELIDCESYEEVLAVAGAALAIDPYDEALNFKLILALTNTNRKKAAREQYERMTRLFNEQLGVAPSKELRAQYKLLTSSDIGTEKNLDTVRARLHEENCEQGAFLCEFEFFRDFYRQALFSAARGGRPIHLGLINADGRKGSALPQSARKAAMKKLGDCIQKSLRRSDVFSRYSVSQYLVLLPLDSYEDSEEALRRTLRCFRRGNPNSSLALTYSIMTIDPDL